MSGEFTGDQWIPRTKASDAELWCFHWSTSSWHLVQPIKKGNEADADTLFDCLFPPDRNPYGGLFCNENPMPENMLIISTYALLSLSCETLHIEIVNTKAADDMVEEGAKTSLVMSLTSFTLNIPFSAAVVSNISFGTKGDLLG